jgi:hypothetical protein
MYKIEEKEQKNTLKSDYSGTFGEIMFKYDLFREIKALFGKILKSQHKGCK